MRRKSFAIPLAVILITVFTSTVPVLAQSAPSVTTGATTVIGASNATLNGTINANGSSTTVTFEYGETTAYGIMVTAGQNPVAGSTDTAVSANVFELNSDTTYHYRAVGSNAGGTSYGMDMTFTTLETKETEIDIFPETVAQLLIEQPGGVVTPNSELPPKNGGYRSPQEVFAEYSGPDMQIVLQDTLYNVLSESVPVITNVGADELQLFEISMLTNIIGTLDPTEPVDVPVQMELTGMVQTIVRDKADTTVGSFDAEIFEMNLEGTIPVGPPIMIRENPAYASTGQINITDIGGGLYHVDSYFDVFTELSVDGGTSWISSTESVRIELVELQFVPLVGQAKVHTFFEGPIEGDAFDDDGNGLDEVRTEIQSMALNGMTSTGPIQVSVRTDLPTEGEIEERVNNNPGRLDLNPFYPGDASSFFDFWPEIMLDGQVLVTEKSMRLETTIYHKPPQDGEWYRNPFLPRAELIDSVTGEGSGIFVWREIHQFDVPTLSVNDAIVNEADGVAIFTVSLSNPSAFPVTVDYFTADGTATAGSDYTAVSGTLTFPAGETIGTISVPILYYFWIYEVEETFSLNLSNPNNATIGDSHGIGTIVSNDVGCRLELNGHYYEVVDVTDPPEGILWSEAASWASYSSFHGIQGHLATINTVYEQMLINSLRLTLPVDDHNLWFGLHRLSHDSPWVWVTGEPGPAEGGFEFWYGDEGEGAPNNIDQWYAMMCNWYGDNTGRWGSFGNGVEVRTHVYAVEYPDPPPTADASEDQSVTVGTLVTLCGGASSDPDDDYPLIFSWNISGKPEGSTAALDDSGSVTPRFTPDLPGTYVITLVVDDSYGVSSDPDQVTVIVDGQQPTMFIDDVTVNEDENDAIFTVSLSNPSSFTVTVDYSTADGTATEGIDYSAISSTLVFAPGETTKTISFLIVDDLLYEGDETFYINLSNPANATIGDDQGIGTILNDDLIAEIMVEALIDVVDTTDELSEATKTSLNASLNTALKLLNDSNPKNDMAAINALEAFIKKVEAQIGKKIPEEVADELITKAQGLIAVLSAET